MKWYVQCWECFYTDKTRCNNEKSPLNLHLTEVMHSRGCSFSKAQQMSFCGLKRKQSICLLFTRILAFSLKIFQATVWFLLSPSVSCHWHTSAGVPSFSAEGVLLPPTKVSHHTRPIYTNWMSILELFLE